MESEKPKSRLVQFVMPDDMYEWLKEEAKRNRTSITQELRRFVSIVRKLHTFTQERPDTDMTVGVFTSLVR